MILLAGTPPAGMKRASTTWTTVARAPFAEREGRATAVLRARRTSYNGSSRRLQSAPKARQIGAAAKEHLASLRAPRGSPLGGYHLAGEGMEPRIEPTIHDLANRVRPRVVAPGHCTGWRAKAALAHTFAPGNYGPSVVGSLYALRAT